MFDGIFGSSRPQMAPTPTQLGDFASAFSAFQERGQPTATAVAEPPREQAFPAAPEPDAADVTPVSVDRDVLAQHAALASKLGVHSDADRELRTAEFEMFLRDSGLRVYDEKQVAAYLTSQYGVEKKDGMGQTLPTWGWRPARKADVPQQTFQAQASVGDNQWQAMQLMAWRSATSGPNGQVQRWATQYAKPIPIPVLLTMERVVEKFPDVRMYVSDEFHPREFVKDPFLMVEHQGKHYIIERWDEPNYRER